MSHINDNTVKQLIIRALQKFSANKVKEAIKLLLNMEIGDNEQLSDSFCEAFDSKYGIPPDKLQNEDLKYILKKLARCNKISDNTYHIDAFLGYCSSRVPELYFDFLLKRLDIVKAKTRHSNMLFRLDSYLPKGNFTLAKLLRQSMVKLHVKINTDRYQPFPYEGFQHNLKNIISSPNYAEMLKKVRNLALKFKYESYWLPELFAILSDGFSQISINILNEWVESGEKGKIEAVSALLKKAPKGFAFSNHEFITQLLENAYNISKDCYEIVRSDLYSQATSGERFGTAGLPMPQDIEVREHALIVLHKYSAGTISYEFYSSLMKYAENEIRNTLVRDEELLDL